MADPLRKESESRNLSARRLRPVPGRPATPPRETSRDYAHPYRPFPLGLVNSVGRGIAAVGLSRPLTPEGIIADAARRAGAPKGFRGLTDDYREGLEVLIESIEREADLNTLGRMIVRGRLTATLRSRFGAELLMDADPSILDASLAPPVVITGLQRTGTTLLHRLMAADRRFRSLSSWEVLDPAPRTRGGGRREDPRLRAARMAEKGAAWMSPDFFAVHPIDHRAPEEDVLLLDTTFKSQVAEAILRVPSYSLWLEQADSTPAYDFMRKLFLLFQRSDRRPFWILKTPHHLEYLDVLMTVFPEARVVQGHRDPSKTLGSFLSMVAHGHGMFTDRVDAPEIGCRWSRKCLRMVQKGMDARAALPPDEERRRFLDVQFADLMREPLQVLERIYDFAGLDFDAEAEASASRMLGVHGRYRYGRHVYDLADFGIRPQEVRHDYGAYISRYRIPMEDGR